MPGVEAAIASRSTDSASGTERVWILRISGATGLVGRLHRDAAVEAPGAQQRGIEDLGTVRAPSTMTFGAGLEAVHLGEDLVERLLALVVAAAEAAAARALAPDGVELVDEDDRGRGLLGLLEQVAHARRAHADDGLDELDAEIEKNAACASPATARASNVLPVPGGP
jgi:hypothetical protein